MGDLDGRLEPEENSKLSDAAPLGRSKSIMSATELTEYAGAAWAAFNNLEARVAVRDSGPVNTLNNRLDDEMKSKLQDASTLGRSARKINKTELTEFAGSLYLSYEALTARVNALDSLGLGSMEAALEQVDRDQLVEAGVNGRSRSQLNDVELTEWAGATDAAYTALEARVLTIESGT